MKHCLKACAIGAALVFSSAMSWAAGPATSFSPGPLSINVTAVEGGTQYRAPGETKWHPLKAGTTLAEGGELRTGPKGVIQFTVGPDQVYRVDRLTVVKLLRANLSPDGTIKTDVGMTYGRVSKDIDAPARPHEDTIVTPSSTLAVRGTRVSLYDQPPYEPEAISLTGTFIVNFNKLANAVPVGTKGGGTTTVTESHTDPTDQQLPNTVVTPTPGDSLTTPENAPGLPFNTGGLLKPLSNPPKFPTQSDTGMPSFAQLQNIASGALTFFVSWDSDTHVQMSLIGSIPGGGEFVYPHLGFNESKHGGQILFDNLGGPGGGYEVITYKNLPPDGYYTIGATNLGDTSTTVTFDAFINTGSGKHQLEQFTNPPIGTDNTPISPEALAPGATDAAYTFVPTGSPIGPGVVRGNSTPFASHKR